MSSDWLAATAIRLRFHARWPFASSFSMSPCLSAAVEGACSNARSTRAGITAKEASCAYALGAIQLPAKAAIERARVLMR